MVFLTLKLNPRALRLDRFNTLCLINTREGFRELMIMERMFVIENERGREFILR
jgi:hypothetical protein